MEAMKGNKNAEKWTEATVLPILEEIREHAQDAECLWLGSALVKVGLYGEIWSYWKEKFANNETVFQSIKAVEQSFESKLFEGALKGDLVASVSIFGLKNNHGWKDQSQVDHTSGGKEIRNVNFNVVTQPNGNTPPAEDLEDK